MRERGGEGGHPDAFFLPQRNCRFQCHSRYNPQSQQMISLVRAPLILQPIFTGEQGSTKGEEGLD